LRRHALAAALLVAAGVAGADSREGVRPEDRIDVTVVDRQLLAIRAGDASAVVSVDLELGETVLASRSRGLVGVALTSVRLLGVTSGSSGWHELRYRVRERESPPAEFELQNRLAGLAPGGTGWIELQLGLGEAPVSTHSRTNVAVAVTARRAVALSARSGFVSVPLAPEENRPSVSLEDSSATLTTSRRVLVFRSGDLAWREIVRQLGP
jgi:hypothetical protein